MESWGSEGIWRVGETTLWYVEGVTEGDSKIAAADIPVKMDEVMVKERVDPAGSVRCEIPRLRYNFIVHWPMLFFLSNRLLSDDNEPGEYGTLLCVGYIG